MVVVGMRVTSTWEEEDFSNRLIAKIVKTLLRATSQKNLFLLWDVALSSIPKFD